MVKTIQFGYDISIMKSLTREELLKRIWIDPALCGGNGAAKTGSRPITINCPFYE